MSTSCPIGELALRIGVAVLNTDLTALKAALADTYHECDDQGGEAAVKRAIALMSPRQKQWFEAAVVQIQQGG